MKHRPFSWRTMPAFTAVSWVVMVFFYAPLIILVIYGFNANDLATQWGGFSTKWFVKAAQNDDLVRSATNSLIVATSATLGATCLAIPAAIAFERGGRFFGRTPGEGVLSLPLMAPDIVTAISTLMFFSFVGIRLGLGNVILAHTVFCIPFAVLPIRARLREMPADIEDAARDLYSGPWEVFRLVTLPALMPGIVAGALMAFVISLDDFIITLMVAEAGSTTLPVYLYGMLRQGVTPEANAAAAILLVVSVTCVVLAHAFAKRKSKT
ncbi:ABC transporter permease [Ruegeria halocynthiae]|uniref:ABC transporter permease n=1 Tax=Ruegeria halocynthiae TaxID=985054 RepID=UPI0005624A2A|nr:ABC transporter permease [Ruegeria halocynthiae]